MFDTEKQPERDSLHGERPRYRYGYGDVGAVCGVSGDAARQWFRRRGWRLGEDAAVNLGMVCRYVEAVGMKRRPLPIPTMAPSTPKAPSVPAKVSVVSEVGAGNGDERERFMYLAKRADTLADLEDEEWDEYYRLKVVYG